MDLAASAPLGIRNVVEEVKSEVSGGKSEEGILREEVE